MDAVDDFFPPYNFAQWDTPQLQPPAPINPSPVVPDQLPDPAGPIFASEQPPVADPTDIPVDLSAALGANFALPNSLSFMPSQNSPLPITSTSAATHMQQLQQVVQYSQPQPDHNPLSSDRQPPPPNRQDAQPNHHQHPMSGLLPQHESHYSHQQNPQPPRSQQHSQNSQLSLFQSHHVVRSSPVHDSPALELPPPDHGSQPQVAADSKSQLSGHSNLPLQRTSTSNKSARQLAQQPRQAPRHQSELQLQIQLQQSEIMEQRQRKQRMQQQRQRKQQPQQQQTARRPQTMHSPRRKSAAQRGQPPLSQSAMQKKPSQPSLQQAARRNSLVQRQIQKQRSARQPKQQTSRNSKVQQPQNRHPQYEFNAMRQGRDASALSTSQEQSQLHKHLSHPEDSILAAMAPTSSIPGLSSLSIPTPTIATGTTITGSPSTTNSTHRSPPQTPHSSNRVKSTSVSGSKDNQSDVRSSVDKTSSDKKGSQHQSLATNANKNMQTSLKQNPPGQAPTSASASAQHPAALPGTSQRIAKPRDKHAKLRKRLRCCSNDQLIDQLIELVRSSAVPEKRISDHMPRIDLAHYVSKCQELRDAIFTHLPDDAASATSPFDANAFRKCKKALAAFKTSVVNMGKTLVEASLWTDVIQYCVAAEGVNSQTPVWSEANHNKTKSAVRTRLEQFALKAATAMSKPKEAATIDPDDHLRTINGVRNVFPRVAAKLRGDGDTGIAESLGRSHDFDDPMISTTQLDIDV